MPGATIAVAPITEAARPVWAATAAFCASVVALPFPDDSFAGALCHRLLQHIPTAVERIDILRELWAHQEWADAGLWRALLECDAALEDSTVRERTLHIHHAQDAFLRFAAGEALDLPAPHMFGDLAAIRDYGRGVLERGSGFLAGSDTAWMDRPVMPPWKQVPPLRFKAGEGLLQAIMHSQHHRGQNASRLRALGGEPPTTDLILWISAGRPAPDWG